MLAKIVLTMIRLLKLFVLASTLVALQHDRYLVADPALPFDTLVCHAINSLLGICILLDLAGIVVNVIGLEYDQSWDHRIGGPDARLKPLDIAFCLLWSCINLSPWGLLTVLSDATQRFFFRWAQALRQSHA